MTFFGRILVRVLSYVSHLVLVALALTSLVSDLRPIRALGVFLVLFLIDRFIHFREADRPFNELPKGGKVNTARFITPRAFSSLEKAFDRSSLTEQSFFLELGMQLSRSPDIKEGLVRLDVNPEEFKQKLEEFLPKSRKPGGLIRKEALLLAAQTLITSAFEHALSNGHRFIGPTDLFSVLPLMKDEFVLRLFNIFGIVSGDLGKALIFTTAKRQFSHFKRLPASLGGFMFERERELRHRIMNRAWTSRPTPILDRFSRDFTDLARRQAIGFLVGHETEYERLVDTLSRPVNPNALLIGEAGIGKETLVARLAFQIIKDAVPKPLFDRRLVALELSTIVAGAAAHELHSRLQALVEEINIAGNIILYIPDIHNLVKTSGTAYLSAADALMPIIMNNSFPFIGSTYPREFKEYLEPRSDFVGIFEIIRVEEITEEEAEKLLVYESLILEKNSKMVISFGAVKKSVKLAKKYFRNKFLPASAEELLKSAVVEASRRDEKFLGPDAVIRAAEAKVNIPIHEAKESEAKELLNLEAIIHERLIDQDEPVKAVSDALRAYRSGLSRPGGPIASFLFVGPTGVGKTELAKILAGIQFGSKDLMVRFDMTEYQDKQSFYRFIGSPDGKITGSLTEAVLQKPYSLILLDEFEKAYPDILNLFLQVFDDGRLTDNLGRVVDFQNTILIATSNAHSDIINESLKQGQTMTQIAEYLKRKLTDVFRPELLNRFSKIIIFKDLSAPDVQKIAALNLKDLAETVSSQGITLTFDSEVVKLVAKWGYDPASGARPLRRVIEDKVKNPLAQGILKKEFVRGSRVKVVVRGEELEFQTEV
ncbi:MAG: ATP-dependent Clp protease ATP-binding subunit [Candidatus Liptonbacteria bacterium]|nr:ATP-dependent Clp protease ATP-binding subunit [Candidatus Liptonbacteria bacterium]